jgi:hypothetical protein
VFANLGQSVKDCFVQNANQTTGGTFGKITAAAAALVPFAAAASIQVKNIYQSADLPGPIISLNMRLAVSAAIEVGGQVGAATGNIGTGATVGTGVFIGMFNGVLAAGYAGSVAGGAALGTAIGSAL